MCNFCFILTTKKRKKKYSFINTQEKCVGLYINKCKYSAMCCHVNMEPRMVLASSWNQTEWPCRYINQTTPLRRVACTVCHHRDAVINDYHMHCSHDLLSLVVPALKGHIIWIALHTVSKHFQCSGPATDQRWHLMKWNRWWTVWMFLVLIFFSCCKIKKKKREKGIERKLFKSSILLCKCLLLLGP